jgi:hypothetical protein
MTCCDGQFGNLFLVACLAAECTCKLQILKLRCNSVLACLVVQVVGCRSLLSKTKQIRELCWIAELRCKPTRVTDGPGLAQSILMSASYVPTNKGPNQTIVCKGPTKPHASSTSVCSAPPPTQKKRRRPVSIPNRAAPSRPTTSSYPPHHCGSACHLPDPETPVASRPQSTAPAVSGDGVHLRRREEAMRAPH